MTTRFRLPPGSDATAPPELRGLERDQVRLLVARPTGVQHLRFRDLPTQLHPGDLLVVNTSATVAAALDARRSDGSPVVVHVAGPGREDTWTVEVRRVDASGPDDRARAGLRLALPGDVQLTLDEPFPQPAAADSASSRLWRATRTPRVALLPYLSSHGRPVAYKYQGAPRPLQDYQNVYADVPGSAEMPSAGRPFTATLILQLMTRGVVVAPTVLHAGLSSPELHEPPIPERYQVPEVTARLVTSTRRTGRRVVAVGTTVVRALESATGPDGVTRAARGWTDLVLSSDRPARAVNGLISGLHPPEASHLLLLDAVAGRELTDATYRAAVDERYLWHEFGDSTLLLP